MLPEKEKVVVYRFQDDWNEFYTYDTLKEARSAAKKYLHYHPTLRNQLCIVKITVNRTYYPVYPKRKKKEEKDV